MNWLIKIIDTIIVLLNVSMNSSVVPYLFFHLHLRIFDYIVVIILDIAYIGCRFKKTKIPHDILFYLFILVNISNLLSIMINDTWSTIVCFYLILNCLFFIILYNIFCIKGNSFDSLKYSMKGYLFLCVWSVIGIIIMSLLVFIGFDPTRSLNITESYDLFKANSEDLEHTYYYPYHISVILCSKFNTLRICGLFHEPHVSTFYIFPALFFLFAFLKNKTMKIVLLLMWIFVMVIDLSTTNILAFLFVIGVYLFLEKSLRWWLVPFSLILLLVIYIGIENTELFFLYDKLAGDDSSSREYTLGTLKFAFTPHSLLGSNFFNNDYLFSSGGNNRDVGFLSFFLNTLFLIVLFVRTIHFVVMPQYRLIGLGILYFILHSTKTAMTTYSSPLLMLIIFILFCLSKIRCDNLRYGLYNKNLKE